MERRSAGARGGAVLLEQEAGRRANTTVQFRNVQFAGNVASLEEQYMLLSHVVFDNVPSAAAIGCGGALAVLSTSPQQTAVELHGVRFDSNRGKCMCPPPSSQRTSQRRNSVGSRETRFHHQRAVTSSLRTSASERARIPTVDERWRALGTKNWLCVSDIQHCALRLCPYAFDTKTECPLWPLLACRAQRRRAVRQRREPATVDVGRDVLTQRGAVWRCGVRRKACFRGPRHQLLL